MRESRLWQRRRTRDFFLQALGWRIRVAWSEAFTESLNGLGEVEVIPIYPGFFSCFSFFGGGRIINCTLVI
jgi:hypothetical protein